MKATSAESAARKIIGAANAVTALEAALPKPEGIRGMVPVAYLKDCLQGAIDRFEHATGAPLDSPLAYLQRRLADVEAL
jgi:hypothetical protein